MITASMLVIIMVGLFLPLSCLYILNKEEYSPKQVIVDGLIALLLFFVFLFIVNRFELSEFDEDSISSFGIWASLGTTLLGKRDIYKVLPYNSISLVIIKFFNLLFNNVISLIFHPENIEMYFYIILGELIKIFFILGTTYLVSNYLTRHKIRQQLHYKTNQSIKISIFGLFIYIALYALQNYGRSFDYTKTGKDIIPTMLSGVMILSILWLANYTKNKRTKDLLKEKELYQAQLIQYMNRLESTQLEMRKFKHDYKNMLLGMAGYIEAKDMEGLSQYFSQHITPQSNQLKETNLFTDLSRMQVIEIKGLVMNKLLVAQEQDLQVTLEIAETIEKIEMDIVDLCRCLGVLLDNAIEASILSKVKEIKVAFVNYEKMTEIIVENSVGENIPSVHLFFEEGFSTKGKNRGLGLSNVRTMIDSYENITLQTFQKEGTVTQCMIIEKGEY